VFFGSAARGEATEESDADLFFELFSMNDREFARSRIEFALDQFAKSRQYREWSLRGIKNEIRPFISILGKSSDLQKSLIADGIILYSEFTVKQEFKHNLLISFLPIRKKSRRYRLDRYLFGRKEKKRKYVGAVEQAGGIKIDSRTLIVPSTHAPQIIKKLREGKTEFSIRDFWAE